jgi:hypothetical protein
VNDSIANAPPRAALVAKSEHPRPFTSRPLPPIRPGDDSPDALGVELVHRLIDKLDDSRAFLARVDRSPGGPGWRDVRQDAANAMHSAEADLAYALESHFGDEVPIDDEREVMPFGVVRDATAYVVRFNPGDMSPGIIGIWKEVDL